MPAAVADAFIASKAKAGVDVRPDFSSPEYYKHCGCVRAVPCRPGAAVNAWYLTCRCPHLGCRWNLHNLPFAPGSILRHVPQIINGINVPWLYIGMLFASFAWHVEDNYLCSISYLHYGSPKIWCVASAGLAVHWSLTPHTRVCYAYWCRYGANAASAAVLEKTMKSQVHARFAETPDLLYHVRDAVLAG